MTERAYKAAASMAGDLNVLTAYQVKTTDNSVWNEISIICLRVEQCTVQATEKTMEMLVL